MLVFGHVAAAGVVTRWVDETADLRWVVFFGLLADLVDKPIGLMVLRESLNSGRVYCHSLLVNLLLTVALVAFRKPLVYALALWIHQLVDLMWTRPEAALWPITGAFGYRDLSLDQWVDLTLNPYHLSAEALGVVVIAFFAIKYRLLSSTHLFLWMRTGALTTCRLPQSKKIGPERMVNERKGAGSFAG